MFDPLVLMNCNLSFTVNGLLGPRRKPFSNNNIIIYYKGLEVEQCCMFPSDRYGNTQLSSRAN